MRGAASVPSSGACRLVRLPHDARRAVLGALLGTEEGLRLRVASRCCGDAWAEAAAPLGLALFALSAERAAHPAAAALGICAVPIPALRPRALRVACAAARRRRDQTPAVAAVGRWQSAVWGSGAAAAPVGADRADPAGGAGHGSGTGNGIGAGRGGGAGHWTGASSGSGAGHGCYRAAAIWLLADWLLQGCCVLQPQEGLDGESWLLASGFTFGGEVYLPPSCGCMPWPSADVLLRVFRTRPRWAAGARVLELGAGSGRVGLELAARAARVVLTDVDASCLELLRLNASLREGRIEVDGPLRFGDTALPGGGGQRFDLVLANDVLYPSQEPETLSQLLATAAAFLEPDPAVALGLAECGAAEERVCPRGFLLNLVRRNLEAAWLLGEAAVAGFACELIAREVIADPSLGPQADDEALESLVFLLRPRAW